MAAPGGESKMELLALDAKLEAFRALLEEKLSAEQHLRRDGEQRVLGKVGDLRLLVSGVSEQVKSLRQISPDSSTASAGRWNLERDAAWGRCVAMPALVPKGSGTTCSLACKEEGAETPSTDMGSVGLELKLDLLVEQLLDHTKQQLGGRLEALEAQVRASSLSQPALQQKLESLLDDLEAGHEQRRLEIGDLQQQVKDLQELIDRTASAARRDAASTVVSELEIWSKAVNGACAEVANHAARISVLERRLEDSPLGRHLDQAFATLEAQVTGTAEAHQQAASGLERELAAREGELRALQEQVARLCGDMDVCKGRLEAPCSDIRVLQDALERESKIRSEQDLHVEQTCEQVEQMCAERLAAFEHRIAAIAREATACNVALDGVRRAVSSERDERLGTLRALSDKFENRLRLLSDRACGVDAERPDPPGTLSTSRQASPSNTLSWRRGSTASGTRSQASSPLLAHRELPSKPSHGAETASTVDSILAPTSGSAPPREVMEALQALRTEVDRLRERDPELAQAGRQLSASPWPSLRDVALTATSASDAPPILVSSPSSHPSHSSQVPSSPPGSRVLGSASLDGSRRAIPGSSSTGACVTGVRASVSLNRSSARRASFGSGTACSDRR